MSLEKSDELKELISAARGEEKADLVLKNAKVLNVFTGELEECDVAIRNGYIAGLGSYEGYAEIDLAGKIICPGLIDGHIHIESSMLAPSEFAKAVLPHGTTAVICDPHEIANVAGAEGLSFMLESSKDLPFEVFFMLPSCVPATPLDEAGAELNAASLNSFYANIRVLGLAELMNSYGTVRNDREIISKILGAQDHERLIDGHAPGLTGRDLNAYVAAGVESDHECSTAEEAIEKLKRGQWIMIREGTAAKNLNALLPLFDDKYCDRCMLVTDDKHPGDLIELGHIDYIIREAIKAGKKPANAIKMASFNAASYFGLKHRGAIAPGYRADLLVVSDLEEFKVEKVYKKGKLVAEDGKICIDVCDFKGREDEYPRVYHSFKMRELSPQDFVLMESGSQKRVIEMIQGELLTKELIVPANLERAAECAVEGHNMPARGVELDKDIIKIALIERHKNTGHVGVGFVKGYGIKYGAIASSVAHDSHNLIVAGTNDEDMAVAANAVRENEGGLA
nr:adenine deaminase [Lachnospiraceae bacterium]